MKRNFLLLFLLVSPLRAQIDPTGATYPSSGPASFDGSTWEEFRNTTGATVNVQVTVTSNIGTTWMALEGDSGVPTLGNVAPGATIWLATYSYGSGGFGFYSEERAITGYTIVAVPNRAPSIAWEIAPATAGSGQGYTIAARGTDADGNLAAVTVWKRGAVFAQAGPGDGFGAVANGATTDAGPQTVSFSAQAFDASGAASTVISWLVNVAAPITHTLTAIAGPGGSVSAGGTFPVGSTATIAATAAMGYDFQGWTGDAAGSVNPASILMDRDRLVQANFTPKLIPLATSATAGGTVTPGGSYAYGTTATITASPDAEHQFMRWEGDANGSVPSFIVTLLTPTAVKAVFASKLEQAIDFPPPGNVPIGSEVTLAATASSGLSVAYAVQSGTATIVGNRLRITDPGAVTVEATQPGDAIYLPAPAVSQTLNDPVTARVKYRGVARTTLLETRSIPNLVLESP